LKNIDIYDILNIQQNSMSDKKFYITTPIYYPNGIPHIGHAYTTLAADILARYHKLKGDDVFFLTGTDEHGKKIEESAQKNGLDPKTFVDQLIPEFKSAWESFNIEYDRFIRTSDKDHYAVVQNILQQVYDKGDIYLGEYEGWYCTACEAYYQEKDLENKCCPIHKKEVQWLKEETYFFKLSKYQKQIKEICESGIITPDFRKEEILNRIEEGLKDLSISRKNLKWGIPLPFDENHTCYVWFDALANYLTGIKYLESKEQFKKYWPADAHIMAKDILWFHTAIWFGILLSLDLEMPKKVVAHGFWTLEGEKISKTTGNYITPIEMIDIAGVDSARYYLFSSMAFGQDGDINKAMLIEKHNSELANNLGNLVMRTSALIEKSEIKQCENKLAKKININEIEKHFDYFELHKVLENVFSFISECNKYIDANEIWKTKDPCELYQLADSIKIVAIILYPFMPQTCQNISKTLNFKISWDKISQALEVSDIKKSEPLFKKI